MKDLVTQPLSCSGKLGVDSIPTYTIVLPVAGGHC